ncbi:MAG: hypothetical protein WDM96_04670 [Lacunisphaera sp.]
MSTPIFIRPRDVNVSQRDFKLAVHQPGALYLARVRKEHIFDGRDAYEWFSGLDQGRPAWGPLAGKRPVFENPDGTGWCVSASYNPGLGRYLLATEHGVTSQSLLGIYDAPAPLGPVDHGEILDRAGSLSAGNVPAARCPGATTFSSPRSCPSG